MPILRVLPSAQSGRALLELRNDYPEPVTVEDVFLDTRSSGPLTPLIAETLDITPGKARTIDITESLRFLFPQETSGSQETVVKILLRLEPEPPNQPAPSYYLLKFQKGRFTEFSSG